MGNEYSAEYEPFLTWSIDNGYRDPLDQNYPRNVIGGIVDDSYVFVLNQSKTNKSPVCDYFNGFKVRNT